jgi:hypothetical protein
LPEPLCIDLFCGLGGWADGFLSEGYDVIGFDIERHDYGTGGYPGQLVLQDVLTLHGSQFRSAAVIVASPPCQNYSYLAMPWSRSTTEHSQKAKAMRRKWETEGPDNRLFDACFRIQREAIQAAGHYIPLIVENVRGAIPWVVRPPRWAFGSFVLWGDIPALMPIRSAVKNSGGSWFGQRDGEALERNDPRDMRRDASGEFVNADATGGWNHPGKRLDGLKRPGQTLSKGFNNWPKDDNGAYVMPDGTKIGGDWFSDSNSTCRKHGSRSLARKAASAQIAKIPFPLSRHIAQCFKPITESGN